MDNINNFLKENQITRNICGMMYCEPCKRLECVDGFSISIQANKNAYCMPRKDLAWPYNEVELGFPSIEERSILKYAEDGGEPTETIYPYVPIELVNKVIEKHGGIKNFSRSES